MVINESKSYILAEVIIERIMAGHGSLDEILSLKKEYNTNIIEINTILQDLIRYDIIRMEENKFIFNNKIS